MGAFIIVSIVCFIVCVLTAVVGLLLCMENNPEETWNIIGIFVISIIFGIFATFALVRVGNMQVKTTKCPKIEYKITEKIDGNKVERDTIYIYKFDRFYLK